MKNPKEKLDNTVLKSVLDNINDAIFIHDLQGHFLLVNSETCRRLGYTKAELLKIGPQKIDSPKFAKLVPQRIKELKEKNQAIFESEHITKAGRSIPVEISSKVIEFNSQPAILSIARDIALRKQTEALIKKQKEEQEIILDSIPAWIFYKDTKNRFVKVNQSFCEVMNKTKKQLEGKSMSEFYPEDQVKAFWKDDKEVIKSGRAKRNIIESMSSPKGLLWVKTDKIPYRNNEGRIIGIIGFTVDITELKNMENKIKESEIMLRLIIQNSGQLIYNYNLSTGKIFWSGAVKEVTGYSEEEFINFGIKEWEKMIHPDDRNKSLAALESARKEKIKYHVEYRFKNKSGSYSNIEDEGFFDDHGNMFGTMKDITEREKTKEKLRERAEEQEKINRLMVGRELKMVELKEKIRELSKKLNINNK